MDASQIGHLDGAPVGFTLGGEGTTVTATKATRILTFPHVPCRDAQEETSQPLHGRSKGASRRKLQVSQL